MDERYMRTSSSVSGPTDESPAGFVLTVCLVGRLSVAARSRVATTARYLMVTVRDLRVRSRA